MSRPTRTPRWSRSVLFAWHRLTRKWGLQRRFLVSAIAIISVSTLLLGWLAGKIVESNILYGVAETANSSIAALIYPRVSGIGDDGEISAQDRAALDEVFETSRQNDATRLLQFILMRPDGAPLYVADGGFTDVIGNDLLARAARGELVASLDTVEPTPVGPFQGFGLNVLRIVAPVAGPAEKPRLIAVLYFSARSLGEVVMRAQQQIWAVVIAIGGALIAALYLVVRYASRTISLQRTRLASNLQTSRSLSDENRRLRDASDLLRLEASKANESLLARVGSDIHDGPVQLLTLLILRLSGTSTNTSDGQSPAALARSAMEELRNISSGLVLPELAELTLGDSIRLAVSRHGRATGVDVRVRIRGLERPASTAVKICAYRVVQESLNNAYRHGGRNPMVIAYGRESQAHLAVSGINTAPPDQPTGERLGLIGMRLRVESLGGTIVVGLSRKARVRVQLPLTPLAPEANQALRPADL